jgi:hypothetical protein
MLGELHVRVEETDGPIFDHPDERKRAVGANMVSEWTSPLARSNFGIGPARFGGDLLVQGLSALAPGIARRYGLDTQLSMDVTGTVRCASTAAARPIGPSGSSEGR